MIDSIIHGNSADVLKTFPNEYVHAIIVGAWNENAISKYCVDFHGNGSYSNILSILADKNDHGLHETQKPLKLMECLVSLVTQEGATILDPFAGSRQTHDTISHH